MPHATAKPQDQDRRHHRTGLGIAGDAGAPHSRGAERRAAQLLARRLRRPRRAHRAHPRGREGHRPARRHHGRPARPQDARRQDRAGADPAAPRRQLHADQRGHRRQRAAGLDELRAAAPGREAGRPALPQRRPGATGRRARGGQRCPLQSRGRRRAAFQEGPQPAGHRSRHQRVHRPRPRLPGIRAQARRGRGEPVVRGNGGGHRSRARRGQGHRQTALHHRQDRACRTPSSTSTRS